MVVATVAQRLRNILDEDRVKTDFPSRERFSKDFYWYSPVLKDMLEGKRADYIVYPKTAEEIKEIVSLAFKQHIPVTVRGAATGNYGQIVPMHGGILMDMTKMNNIMQTRPGSVQVEPGVRMGSLEKMLRLQNQELCIYPSTYMKATVGGFVCGGSGGIGSITWGNLWDGNVLKLKVITMEEDPRVLEVEGDDLIHYVHSYGTTGIVVEIVLRTTERVNWMECIASFNELELSLLFSEKLAKVDSIKKRSISTCEWPIPSYFQPLKHIILHQKHIVLLEIEESAFAAVKSLVSEYEGEVTYTIPPSEYQKTLSLSNFTWNHTTLWALKADEKMTYLQGSFDLDTYLQQIRLIKEKFGNEFYNHFDWHKNGGKLTPQQIPLVRFTSRARLDEMVAFCESIGVKIFNPHTILLDEGGWEKHIDAVLRKKMETDPEGLLNPGKIKMSLSMR